MIARIDGPFPSDDPAAAAAGGEARRFPGAGAALALYVLLTVLFTWPYVLHLGDRLPAGGGDLWQNYWNGWWWKTALLERHQLPGRTDMIYQPGDVSLAFHTHSPAAVLSTFPFLVWWNEAAALNVATLLSFPLAAWGVFLLAREVAGHAGAAFIAGLIGGFFPQHFEQSLEHVSLASYQGMPFFLLFFLRLLAAGGARNIVLAAVFFALNALYSWHNGIIVLPLALALLAVALLNPGRGRGRLLRDTAVCALLAAALLLPFTWRMLVEIARGETYYIKPEITKGLDAAFLLLPAENHPLWGGAVRPLYEAWRRYPSAGSTCYLGVVALALAAAGAVHARLQGPGKAAGGAMREAGGPWFSAGGDAERNRMGPMASSGLWAGMFFVYLVLALGQELVVAGRNTGVPLLFALFDGFPLLETQRVANRFAVPAMLALSVLAACGARALIERSRRLPPAAVFWTIVVLAAADYLWAYPLRELPRPAWVEALRQAPAGLLLDIPGGHRARGSEDMYFQTLHGRPTVGGYTSCLPPLVERRVKELPFLELIFEGRPQVNVEVAAGLRDVLETLAVQVVVVHRDRARERLERLAGEHRGTPAARFYNPERGSPESVLAETRAALAGLWGAPRYSDAEAEIYWRP